MTAIAQNTPRLRPGGDHVESWFIRANDPHSPRAVWIKATVLTSRDGTALAQAWCSVFDGRRTKAWCLDIPLDTARFEANTLGQDIEAGPLAITLTTRGGDTAGALSDDTSSISWDFAFTRAEVGGAPLSLLPGDRLLGMRFPSNKLVTPFPVASVAGHLEWDGERWDLGGWHGMQGHNWGSEHSPEYAWGHCVFTDTGDETPFAVLEAASGRTRVGGRVSPLVSMLVIRRGEQEYRFDRVLDLWRQEPHLDFPHWTLRMRGRDGSAVLRMSAAPEQMVCLAYRNPARATSYCLNSKTAAVSAHVTPINGNAFELRSAHGGALEFLLPQPVPAVSPIV
ncbi:hypothetical protein [Nocardia sp. NBC_01327]|uniref:hypothetical protein n=1 Tax=Nocardia sp. NBC_01327 TaxID=2903593 RepID=UPI002E14FB7C|nr:hypothetical protein OG326_25220 [Nocardia sp. NBC_01327]